MNRRSLSTVHVMDYMYLYLIPLTGPVYTARPGHRWQRFWKFSVDEDETGTGKETSNRTDGKW